MHGAALERALWAHAHARLRAPAADESDAARRLRVAARGGGHVLVCGPPGVGKKRAALRLAARLVAEERVRAPASSSPSCFATARRRRRAC